MPDWFDDDIEAELDQQPQPKLTGQEKRTQRRLSRTQARADQLSKARTRTSPTSYLVGAVVLVLVVLGAAYGLPHVFGTAGPNQQQPAAAPATSSVPMTAPTPTHDSTPTGSTTATTSPHASSATTGGAISGDALAKAFLAAYLTRQTPTGTAWQVAAAPYATPALIAYLGDNDAPLAALSSFTSWRPTRYDPAQLADHEVATPARVQSDWIVTVTDGHGQTATVPIGVHCYLTADNTWTVAQLTIGYSGGADRG